MDKSIEIGMNFDKKLYCGIFFGMKKSLKTNEMYQKMILFLYFLKNLKKKCQKCQVPKKLLTVVYSFYAAYI